MADQQQNQQQQQQKQPQRKEQCRFCSKEIEPREKVCKHCGKPLEIECPKCRKITRNGGFCSHCTEGGALPVTASTASTVSKKVEWKIEATDSGRLGQYSVRVQATGNGEGAKAKDLPIYVGADGLIAFDFGNGRALITSRAIADAVDQLQGKTPTNRVMPDANGLLVCEVRFDCKHMELVFAIGGTQADSREKKRLILQGPPFNYPKIPVGASYAQRKAHLAARQQALINYNRGQ